ncbi:hypothetical protein NP493_628g00024 [Ridgeia piscesae]|uniref:Uncharacterized protein n=1 Tax=Ridgeia piscesae TaxID=27915 RepID=A0AAD9KSZ7_RIDPI|nr:hypothetical protein NP493_628g00024 [Ridgeia piscesae]
MWSNTIISSIELLVQLFCLKDPYLSRPLPHLIGTPAFLQSDDIGLIEETSDEDVSDHGSISESESAASSSEDEAQKVNGDAVRERHTGRDRHVSASSSSEAESESSGDLFGRQESDADEDKELKDGGKTDVIETQQTKADDFASELASRIRSSPPPMNTEPKKKKRSTHAGDTKHINVHELIKHMHTRMHTHTHAHTQTHTLTHT